MLGQNLCTGLVFGKLRRLDYFERMKNNGISGAVINIMILNDNDILFK